jgi:uracil-DNA glycosylase family 4
MQCTGEGKKGILIISDYPSYDEDESGKEFSDKGFDRLKQELLKYKVSLDRDCWKVYAVNCNPKEKVASKHIDCCKPFVTNIIEEKKPNKIIVCGNAALESLYGGRTKHMSSVGKCMGLKFWDSNFNAWVFPIWSPLYVSKINKDKLAQSEYNRHIEFAITSDPTPLRKEWNPIHKLIDYTDACTALENCLNKDTLIAIDYETTGLDPFQDGHKTVSFGWANNKGAWAVPVDHHYWTREQQLVIKDLIVKILRKRKIKKIVHNISFEYVWTKQMFNIDPGNFYWDTQLASHIIDNRSGITYLKFQAFMRWGIGEYDDDASNFITSTDGTGFNKMLQMPVPSLLEYNALDALYTYELYKEQQEEIKDNELKAYRFAHEGALVLCEMSYNGIRIKKEYYIKQRKALEQERDALVEEINNSSEVAAYSRKYGKFDYNSPIHVQNILFDVLGLEPIKKTKTGNSVDEEVLNKINIPLTENIIKIRKLEKMMSTYVDAFINKSSNGFLHPSFSLSLARTYRSSSSNPNFQAIPKRDPKAKAVTRSGMVPRDGCVLGEMDFSGAEITTSIFYHKDPNFIAYQIDPEKGDMHRDAGAHILKIKSDELHKRLRQATKGGFTFAEFYGSYYVSCAKKMWDEFPHTVEDDGTPVKVKGIGIDEYMRKTFGSYSKFEDHIKEFERIFWNEWFPVYTKWKDSVVDFHIKHGFIETYLGFKFKGYMDRNKCTNYPIQSTSFHLLLYTAVQVYKEIKRRGLSTLLIGQIHDSIIMDIPVHEIDEIAEIVNEIVSNLHNTFKWMTIPMGLDFEISETYEMGGSFSKMKPYEKVTTS